ncbi:MAG: histidine--tRNA ligase [Erysipelotrichales bacterium]|nr:histidine--tRNA ligase [Erysipelotrichales bacterium]
MYQIAQGTQDFMGLNCRKWQTLEDLIRQITTVYGYQEVRTPIFEYTEVFKRDNDSSDMVNKEMYTFSMGDYSLTLRPEGTAGIVRSFVEKKLYGNPAELPAKMYYMGPMFRHERPQKGRYRQFSQFGVECIGVKSPLLDAECIALGYTLVKALGISNIKIHINTLGDQESRDAYRNALREYFAPHLEELCADCKRRFEQNPLRLLDCKVDGPKEIMQNAPKMRDYLNEASAAYFEEVKKCLDALEIPYEIDDGLVRGLDYYTHTVFEAIATSDALGSQLAVFAGGRYDDLVKYFGGPEMSGVGFAAGMERLIMMAEAEGNELATVQTLDAYVMPLSTACQAKALELTTMLRSNGYIADMDVQGRSMKAMFKSVDRTQATFALILGEDEMNAGEVRVKHIPTQEQKNVCWEELIDHIDSFYDITENVCTCGNPNCTCGKGEN